MISKDVWNWINSEDFSERITEVHDGGRTSVDIGFSINRYG